MLSRVAETDTEVIVKHYRVLGAALAIVASWFFAYETFATESGGIITLLLTTLALVLAAGLAEMRTTRFDSATKTLETTRLGTLGSQTTRIPFADVHSISLARRGNETLALEEVTLHTRADGDIDLASYLVIRNEGAGMDQYIQEWLAQSGWAPRA